ncbi:MAG: hypothetical protein HWE39_20990 [Oceanospirillaceae bacterium]|nr:hypothetical protein [Oceanospirillaceae bacterium]
MQSSRGLTSILLGVLVAWLGLRFAEPLPPWSVLWQRFAAAGLMLFAIALFSLGAAYSS